MSFKSKPQLKLFSFVNGEFQLNAIIDDFQEISFERNLYSAGTFTISINYNIPNALLFQRGLFVQFGNNPYDFGEIITISDSISSDGKGSQIRTITGYDSRYILKRRVIKNMNSNGLWVMTAKGELCIRNLIKDQCGSGAEAKRQLPIINTIPDSSSAIGKEYSVSEQFSNLYEVCKTIATQSEIGWRLNFDGASLTLECYEGTDRSQTVQFSTNFDSLANGEFVDSSESYSNAIYVGGKGQNDDRDIYEGEDGTPTGLDRFESWDNQSSMTTDEEYEAEALSMLTQYGQTIQMSGNGLAKCPYVYKEQYSVGDWITVSFSGKSAVVQILSVTEHWSWGAYDIQFSFGKPLNNLSDQLQLMLRKIQSASEKTQSTDSVRWYTIPTDTSMPKADVTYNTIGFEGNVGSGATFTLYLDNAKTGSKTYHVYFKQLAGSGKLTLTTGKAGATNLVLSVGTYVAIIYVDENGNITTQGATATDVIQTGSTQPAESGAVADEIQNLTDIASSLPTDAVLHYSFDEVPDLPDGTAVYLRNNDFTSTSGWIVPSDFAISVDNNCLKISPNNTTRNYMLTRETNVMNTTILNGKLVKIKIHCSFTPNTVAFQEQQEYRQSRLSLISKNGNEYIYAGILSFSVNSSVYLVLEKGSTIISTDYCTIEQIYIGDGSYSTPIIDNSNGQNNATNNGGLAVEGVSGKGVYLNGVTSYIQSTFPFNPDNQKTFTTSIWFKDWNPTNNNPYLELVNNVNVNDGNAKFAIEIANRTQGDIVVCYAPKDETGYIRFAISYNANLIAKFRSNRMHHICFISDGDNSKLYFDGELLTWSYNSTVDRSGVYTNLQIGRWRAQNSYSNVVVDDLLIFDRALSDTEVLALYQNKANTPKYFTMSDFKMPAKQNSELSSPITIAGQSYTTVESALQALAGLV